LRPTAIFGDNESVKFLVDGRLFRFLLGVLICAIALLLPYRARLRYNQFLSFLIHTPFVLFGIVARSLLERLDLFPGNSDGRKP
jgi:hypothetical protein